MINFYPISLAYMVGMSFYPTDVQSRFEITVELGLLTIGDYLELILWLERYILTLDYHF